MTAASRPKPLAQRPVLWLAIVAGALVAGLAVVAGAAVGNASTADGAGASASSNARPAPSAETPGIPVVVPPPVVEAPSVIPADCEAIYSRDWTDSFEGLVLNPAWTSEEEAVQYGTNNGELADILRETQQLNCQWANESGGSDRNLVTTLAQINPEQQALVLTGLESNFDCSEESGGTRCKTESSDDDGFSGESHFVRDGVWVATRWNNIAPDGYTNDIISTLWP